MIYVIIYIRYVYKYIIIPYREIINFSYLHAMYEASFYIQIKF